MDVSKVINMGVGFHVIISSILVLFCSGEHLNVNDTCDLKLLEKLEYLEAKAQELELKFQRQEKRQQASIIDTPVAFTVTLTQSKKQLGDRQSIEYDHVITNLGNGYEPRTGRFICPVKGLYLFAVTAMGASSIQSGSQDSYTRANSASNRVATSIEVVMDGKQIAKTYSEANAGSSSTSIFVITVDVGQMVWVRSTHLPSQLIHGDGYDMFSGTLLYQIA